MSEAVTPHAGASPAVPRNHVLQSGSAGWFLASVPRPCSPKATTPSSWDRSCPGSPTDWGVPAGTLWPTLSAGLFGLMLGAFFIAPLADNYGRRRVIIYSVAAFGVLTIASVLATNITEMVIFRFLTGLGLGGAMANTAALTAEFSPPHRRAFYVAIMFCSFSLGASFGGFVSACLMDDYGWKSIFFVCGIMAVVLFPFLICLLPESLIKEDAKLTIPFAKLFADGRTRFTILIWIIFFANLMELYIITSWLPTTLNNKGLDLRWANVAVGTGAARWRRRPPSVLAWLVDRSRTALRASRRVPHRGVSVAISGLSGASIVLVLLAALRRCRDGRRAELQ